MNEILLQIIPAPTGMFYSWADGEAQPVACLALVQLEDGSREIRAMGIVNAELFTDVAAIGAVVFMDQR